ncbi:AN1-type zinc finger protein 1-like [Prorops nasuta]|uniref:AN1-type zinc finger protein 1-like n=1 Tax=Prorops nasuta TaxID=863751 RepID=UPI0034D01757
MEFPQTGENCSITDCKQLDFLPFLCEYCQNIFCKVHFNAECHNCKNITTNDSTSQGEKIIYECFEESCKEKSIIEMLCIKCKRHFCLVHRYHGCLEMSEGDKSKKLKKWQIPKKQFAEAKAAVDQEVTMNLKKSKNNTMANKVQYMKVKATAVGPKKVPVCERRYFLVYPPSLSTTPKNVFVSGQWTIGKTIDSISETLKISNHNNTVNSIKLNLFHYATGICFSNEKETLLEDLFSNATLIDGQSIILEYSNDNHVDLSLYKKI